MKDKIIALLKEQGPLTFNEILYGTAGLHCVAPPDHVQQVIHALSDLTREGAISGIASKYQPVHRNTTRQNLRNTPGF
jgi:hypothetical protein